MNLQTAIKQATDHLLKSDKARTYTADVYGETKSYILELARDDSGDPEWKNYLHVTTWGFDYEEIQIPSTRPELIGLKCQAQMAPSTDYPAQVAKRYYLDILRRADA